MDGLTIGGVAERARVHIDTLRYYERRGLVAIPPRSMANYRLYPEDAVRRVRFIKRVQELGFTLKEIKVRAHAEVKIKDIDEKIASLTAMKSVLAKLVAECAGEGPLTDCPILESLETKEVIP